MKYQRVCPVCGNDLVVNPYVKGFRCKFCRRPIKVNLVRMKGKCHIELEEEE